MMMGTMNSETLEDYLAGDYHRDTDDISDLEATLWALQSVFVHSHVDGCWPYERRAGRNAEPPARPSHGTQAMIAAALGKMTGQCTMAGGDLARLASKLEKLSSAQSAGVERLIRSIEGGTLESGTFGINDPVTLSHVVELARGLAGASLTEHAKAIIDAVPEALSALSKAIGSDPASSSDLLPNIPLFGSTSPRTAVTVEEGAEPDPPAMRAPDYVTNAFVPLRIIRAADSLAIIPDVTNPLPALSGPEYDRYRKFFESTLYDQLSFSAIPDSRFDAAELIFCLEGLLLCGRQAVDDRVFCHVLEVLREKQDTSAQWRPNRPIFATRQGMTMLPVNVESAVSLIRSIEIMDRHEKYHRFSTLGIDLARRFWHWLRAHKVTFHAPSSDQEEGGQVALTGWHSEHVNQANLVHLWDTSQVIEFMLSFREMLQRHVAGRTLLLSRLKIDRGPRSQPNDWCAKWDKLAKAFEPRPQGQNRIYVDRLTNDFVIPWGKRQPLNFSMLLYGPPGTGKSSVAENIADALGMRMVTVTVSDFLGRGGTNVEARAKAIFQTLEAQSNTVILFDEIDSFLLDRDTERYRNQDSLFQFLTPGMLTKINDLRKRERSIFIIATNYANRIDPAIKRRGRIDQRYLLSLPDGDKRIEIINSVREKNGGKPVGKITEVREETLFFGYSDLKNLVTDSGSDECLLELIHSGEFKPATNVEGYIARHGEENFPLDELKDLGALLHDVNKEDNVVEQLKLAGRPVSEDKRSSVEARR